MSAVQRWLEHGPSRLAGPPSSVTVLSADDERCWIRSVSRSDHIAGIRALRAETGASMRECKRVLESAGGDAVDARCLIEQGKLGTVQMESGCISDETEAALAHAKGVVERAVEVARLPSVVMEHEFVRVTNRAPRFLAEDSLSLGLYELREILPHANQGPAVAC